VVSAVYSWAVNDPALGPILASASARIELVSTLATAPGAADGALEVVLGPARRDDDSLTFEVAIANRSGAPHHVESVEVVFLAHIAHAGALRFLRHGWQSWSFTGTRELDTVGEPSFPSGAWLRGIHHCVGEPAPRWAGWHESETVTLIGPSHGGPVCLAGVLETGRAFAIVHLRRENRGERGDTAVRIAVEQRVEVELGAGERRQLEPVRVAVGDAPNPLLEEFADAWGEAAGARRGAPYQTGWCSWYHFFHDLREDDVRRSLDAIAAEREAFPVTLIQIDDGYQRAIGDWLQTNDKFPRGLAPLAAEIRAAGLTAGIWTAPFAAAAESDLLREHPDWVLREPTGTGERLRGMFNPAWSADGWVYALDTSRGDVLRHLEATHAALAASGFGYQKLDFLYMAAMEGTADDATLTRAQRLRHGLLAIRRGAGAGAFLLGCGCPLGPAVGLVDGMRIGPDVAPSWGFDPATAFPGLEAALPSTRSAIRSVLNRLFLHRRLWVNDPDCLMARSTDTRLSADEIHTLATAIAIGGGMMVFSDDAAALDSTARRLIRNVATFGRGTDASARRRLIDPLASDDGPRAVAIEGGGESTVATLNLGAEPTAATAFPELGERFDLFAADDGASSGETLLGAHQSALWRSGRHR